MVKYTQRRESGWSSNLKCEGEALDVEPTHVSRRRCVRVGVEIGSCDKDDVPNLGLSAP